MDTEKQVVTVGTTVFVIQGLQVTINTGLPRNRQTPTLLFAGLGDYHYTAVTDLSSNV